MLTLKGVKKLPFAVVFDLDTEKLEACYPNPRAWRNGYMDIRREMEKQGYTWQQGSVYFGNANDAVQCGLDVITICETLPWLPEVVRDIQALEIHNNSNLLPLVNKVFSKMKHLEPIRA